MGKDNLTPPRKKGFSFLSLFLGILFGIILTIGAIVGVGAFVAFTDLKTVFEVVGFENKDENGNDFINTDKDNGGVSTVLDLVSKLTGWVSNINGMTLAEIEGVLPVTNSIVDNLYDSFGGYVARDKDVLLADIKGTAFGDIATLLQGLVDDIVPAKLLSTIDLGEIMDNALMSTIVYGPEADYILNTSTPVWYNEYNKVGESYILDGDADGAESSPLASDLQGYLVADGEGANIKYRLHYTVANDLYRVASYNATDRTFSSTDLAFPHVKAAYDKCTGYYYKEASESERTIVTPVTISTLSGTNGGEGMTSLLNNVELLELLGGEQEKLITDILGGITVGNILNSELEITDKVNNLELTVLDLGVTVDSQIMMYLVYGVTNVTAVTSDTTDTTPEVTPASTGVGTLSRAVDYQYTASYDDEEEGTITVYIESADRSKVDRVYKIVDGEKVDIIATTVSTIGTRIDGITIPAIVDIDIDEPIMAYLGYSIYNVTPSNGTEYQYTAKYDVKVGSGTTTVDAYVLTNEEGIISSVYYLDNGDKVTIGGTTTDGIDDIVGGVTNALALSDILDIGVGDKMVAYLAFKITNIQEADAATVAREGCTHTATLEVGEGTVNAYVTTNNNNITGVYYYDAGVKVYAQGTTINGVSSAVQDISIPAIIDIDPTEPIMVYLGYSIYAVREATATEKTDYDCTHVGKYDIMNGDTVSETVTAYIQSNGTAISGAYYLREITSTTPEGGEGDASTTGVAQYEKININGTSTEDIGDVITNITNKLELATFMDVDAPTSSDKNAIMMYMAYGVRSVVYENENYSTGEYVDEDGNVTPVGINKNSADKYVGSVVSLGSTTIPAGTFIDGTTINGASNRVSTVSNNLTLADFMEIKAPNSADKGAIMMYMAYGVRAVIYVDESYSTGEYVDDEGKTTPVKIIRGGDGLVTSVVATAGGTLPEGTIINGTTINGVSNRVSGVTDNLTLGDFMNIDTPTSEKKNSIMMYIAYGVRSIAVSDNNEITGEYVQLPEGAGETKYIPVTIKGGATVTEVREKTTDGSEGRVFTGTTINGVSPRVSSVTGNLTLADFMNIDAPSSADKNAIMMYMAYGVRSVVYTSDSDISGEYVDNEGKTTPVKINRGSDGLVTSVVATADGALEAGTVITGTTIGAISDRVSGVADNLTLGDFMDVGMPTASNKNSIMMYIAYGVRSIVVSGNTVTGEYVEYKDVNGTLTYVDAYPVTITGGDNVTEVKEITTDGSEGRVFTGTTIKGVSDRVSTVSDNLALADFIKIAAPTDDDKNTIMMYMAYGVRDISIVDGEITGIYEEIDTSTTHEVTVETYDDNGTLRVSNIVDKTNTTKVYSGTTIGQINSRISGVTRSLKIGELMEINENNTIMWSLRNSTVNSLATDISKLSIQEIYKDDIYVKSGKAIEYTVVASGANAEQNQINFDEDYIYYTKVDGELVFVNNSSDSGNRGKLTEAEFGASTETYYTYGQALGVWKFMVYETSTTEGETPTTTSTEKLYSVNDLGDIMTNATNNISNATLEELQEAGIISQDLVLSGHLLGNSALPILGDISINQLLRYLTGTNTSTGTGE